MLTPKGWLLATLAVVTVAFVVFWWRRLAKGPGFPWPGWTHVGIGFLTNFFDTLGIGSFAPTTSLYKLKGLVADELIPGTLNSGHIPATLTQAFIYITIVKVDPWTMALMIAGSVVGSWLGAGVVSRWPRRHVQIGMGFALIAAASLMLSAQLGVTSAGGEALGLNGPRLVFAVCANVVLGALMTLGIGLYAPCLILISLLGMTPAAAFPIMMGSCAFLMPVAGVRFIERERYDVKAAIGLTLGGVPAVLIAAFLVRALPLYALRWLVIVVVVYTALTMLRSAALESRAGAATLEPPPAVVP
jgi:uncharacterized membrane protein YfcA